MNLCSDLLDAMPDVASGRVTWSEHEAAHLATCRECAQTWDITSAASLVGREVAIDVGRVETTVLARLRSPGPVRRPRWHRFATGLAAAAAAALIFTSSRHDAPPTVPPAIVAAESTPAIFPELGTLSAPQLEQILASVDDGADPDVDAGAALPRLGDLTEDQLEQLILSVEGE